MAGSRSGVFRIYKEHLVSNPTKPAGWFSRRHQTNEAHIAANIGRTRREAKERKREQAEARNSRTPHWRTAECRRNCGCGGAR